MKALLTAVISGVLVVVLALCALGAVMLGALVTSGGSCPVAVGVSVPAGQRWDGEQRANAAAIVTVGARMGVARYGWVIAVATAMQESGLRNLGDLGARNDHDSLGLFQQRPSQGWGTPAQILDPHYAAGKFYDKLLTVPGWQDMPLTRAAQAVQVSAYPDAYAKWESAATQLVDLLAGVTQGCSGASEGWVMPVNGALTSGFRPPDRPAHDGIDLAAPKGTPVRAVAAGTVIVVTCNASFNGHPYSCDRDGSVSVQGCGWYLEIQHARNLVTRYCHLLRQPDVAVGATVVAGQHIAAVGASGNSTGPHLHFEVHAGQPATLTNAIDPLPLFRAAGSEAAG